MSKPPIDPLVAIAAGALILLKPKILNFVIAGYLIYTGVSELSRKP